MNANEKQIAGDHYKKYGNLQPWDVVVEWNLGYLEGTALKYIARWKHKGGVEDLKKAIHFLEKAVEVYSQKGSYKCKLNRSTNMNKSLTSLQFTQKLVRLLLLPLLIVPLGLAEKVVSILKKSKS